MTQTNSGSAEGAAPERMGGNKFSPATRTISPRRCHPSTPCRPETKGSWVKMWSYINRFKIPTTVTANEAMAAHGSGSELLVECQRQVCSSSGGIGTAYSSLPAALERSSPYPAKPCQIGGCRLDKDLRQVAICLSKTHATLSAAPSERNKSKTFNASTGNKKVQLPTILQEITVDRKN